MNKRNFCRLLGLGLIGLPLISGAPLMATNQATRRKIALNAIKEMLTTRCNMHSINSPQDFNSSHDIEQNVNEVLQSLKTNGEIDGYVVQNIEFDASAPLGIADGEFDVW